MLNQLKQTFSSLVWLLLGGGGLWYCAQEPLVEDREELPDYDYLAEILELETEGRLG